MCHRIIDVMSRRLLPIAFAYAGLAHALPAAPADAPPKAAPKPSFQGEVGPIFRNRCNTCHNADKAKGGLNLETYASALQGGGSGKVVEPGDPDSSRLWELVSHQDQPSMPPNAPKIPDPELDLIKRWIEAGAPETSGSVVALKAKPKFEFKLDPAAMGKPNGPPAMPAGLGTEPFVVSRRPNAILALAASPWAPLVAVGSHKQVLLYHAETGRLIGVLPFPEGTVYVTKFSRGGDLLLAGGGRGGQSGLVVVWDVKTGKRVFEIGREKEYDIVLAADISPDQGLVALGGPGRVVRVYSTTDGKLAYELKKHTEWITSLEFSPDGVLLATGDRNNGLLVWEAATGREFHELRGHTLAVTDISWRLDSNVVASSSEDGTVRLWEMENGGQVKSWGAHGGGVESVRFSKDGRIVTTGRDHVVRLWDGNGNKQRDFDALPDVALRAVLTYDSKRLIAGDWTGELRVCDAQDGKRLGLLAANPGLIATRLEQAKSTLAAAEAALANAEAALKPFVDTLNTRKAETALSEKRLNDAQATLLKAKAAAENATKQAADAAATAAKVDAELAAARAALALVLTRKVELDKALNAQTEILKASQDASATEAARLKITAMSAASAALATQLDTAAQGQSRALAALKNALDLKTAAAVTLASARKSLADLEKEPAVRRAELEKTRAASAAAEKALAAQTPLRDAARSRRDAAKADVDALTAEKNHNDTLKSAQAAK